MMIVVIPGLTTFTFAFLGRNNGRISNIMDARPVETRKSAASLSENI